MSGEVLRGDAVIAEVHPPTIGDLKETPDLTPGLVMNTLRHYATSGYGMPTAQMIDILGRVELNETHLGQIVALSTQGAIKQYQEIDETSRGFAAKQEVLNYVGLAAYAQNILDQRAE